MRNLLSNPSSLNPRCRVGSYYWNWHDLWIFLMVFWSFSLKFPPHKIVTEFKNLPSKTKHNSTLQTTRWYRNKKVFYSLGNKKAIIMRIPYEGESFFPWSFFSQTLTIDKKIIEIEHVVYETLPLLIGKFYFLFLCVSLNVLVSFLTFYYIF